MNIEDFFTGVRTQNGEKVYLGDRIRGDFYYPFIVQYDFGSNQYVLATVGKDKSPYRSYLVADVPQMPGLRVVSNTLFFAQVQLEEVVRISVKSIHDPAFTLGETVKIIAVNEWDVVAETLDGNARTNLKFNEFLPLWRWE